MMVLSLDRKFRQINVTREQISWSYSLYLSKKICKGNTDFARLNQKVALEMRGVAR